MEILLHFYTFSHIQESNFRPDFHLLQNIGFDSWPLLAVGSYTEFRKAGLVANTYWFAFRNVSLEYV
jgi:hypothetical protein